MNLYLQDRRRDCTIRTLLLTAAIAALITPSKTNASEAENDVYLGDAISGTIDSPEDEDTFGFGAVAGTVISFSLRMSSEKGTSPALTLFDPSGVGLELTPFIQVRMTRRATIVSLKKLLLTETGRYVFSLSIPFDRGEYRLATRAKFPHRIRQAGRISAGEERSLIFPALAESKVTVAIRRMRSSSLALEIIALLDSTGRPVQIDGFALARRRGAVLKRLELNELDVYQLRFRNTSSASGIYKIEGIIKPPRRRSQKLAAKEPDAGPDPIGPQQIWQFQTGGPVRTKPLVAGRAVYVGSNDGSVYALDAATGNMLWQYEIGEPVISSPTVSNGAVFVGCNDHRIYAFDKTNGDLLWRFETGGIIQSSAAVEDGSVFVASYDGFVYALDASTGGLLWKFRTDGLIWTSPTVAGGMLFVGSTDGYLYAIETSSGNLIWRYTTSWNYVISDPIVKDGTLYVAAYEESTYAFDAATGVVKWIHYGGNWITTLPFLGGDTLYYGVAAANTLYALDVSTGLPVWQSDSLEPRQTILFMTDSVLYAMSKGGVLRAIDIDTGQVKAIHDLGISLNALRLSEDGKVFISSEDSGVLAYTLW